MFTDLELIALDLDAQVKVAALVKGKVTPLLLAPFPIFQVVESHAVLVKPGVEVQSCAGLPVGSLTQVDAESARHSNGLRSSRDIKHVPRGLVTD